MIRRNRVILGVIIAGILAVVHMAVFSQEDMESVDNTIFSDPKRPPSFFFHDAHNDAAGIDACDECHHVYENGERIPDESSEDMQCSECHEPVRFGEGITLMKAFHMNCKGCHLKVRKGPVMCVACHKK